MDSTYILCTFKISSHCDGENDQQETNRYLFYLDIRVEHVFFV